MSHARPAGDEICRTVQIAGCVTDRIVGRFALRYNCREGGRNVLAVATDFGILENASHPRVAQRSAALDVQLIAADTEPVAGERRVLPNYL